MHRKGNITVFIKDPEAARRVLRMIFEAILGRGGFTALQYHLRRILGREPLQVFYESPREFYEGLEGVFGESGAKVTFRILYGRLIALSGSERVTSDELLELLIADESAAKEVIVEMLEEILRRGRGDVT